MNVHSAKRAANIDRLRIATPCPISWDQMTGDKRVRFCGHCQLNVYNISELSRLEAESLIAATEGRLCARLFRRADGTILTNDCPVGLRAFRRRVAKRTATIFAAMVSLSAAVFGQQPSAKDAKTSCTPQTRITRGNASADAAAQILSGSVVDQSGGAVARAKVTVRNAATNEVEITATNEAGRFAFGSLAPGNYAINIEADGFITYRLMNITIEKDRLIGVEMILKVQGEVLIGVVAMDDLFDTPLGTTIISGEMIRRLPIQK